MTVTPRRYLVDGRIGKLTVAGAGITVDVAERVTSATLSLSTSEVSQLELTIRDPDLELLAGGFVSAGTQTKAGTAITYAGLALECRAVEVGSGPVLTITARSAGVQALKRRTGALARRAVSPTRWAQLEAASVGLKFVGENTPTRPTIVRAGKTKDQAAESSWDVIQRLANEVGFLAFEAAGVLYFARPSYLVTRSGVTVLPITYAGRRTVGTVRDLPTCRRSGDDDNAAATMDVDLFGDLGDAAIPGAAAVLYGVPTFDGRYLVMSVTFSLAEGAPVAVSTSTPTNPTAQPATAVSSPRSVKAKTTRPAKSKTKVASSSSAPAVTIGR